MKLNQLIILNERNAWSLFLSKINDNLLIEIPFSNEASLHTNVVVNCHAL
jgi:hypothetical protein